MMDDPIIKAMKEKMDEVTNDKALRAYALSREMGKQQQLHQQEMIKKQQEEINLQKKEIQVKQKEIEAKQEEINAKQEEIDAKQEEFDAKRLKMLKFISEKLNCSIHEAEEIFKNL